MQLCHLARDPPPKSSAVGGLGLPSNFHLSGEIEGGLPPDQMQNGDERPPVPDRSLSVLR